MRATRPGPMVVACLRIGDLRPRVDPLSGAVVRDPLGLGISPADAAALEYGFRIASAWGGHVVAVAAAPPSADPVLREAAALGATVVRVAVADPFSDQGYAEDLAHDEREVAAAIVAALAPYGRPALVLCGDRSADRGTGALPAFLAHQLGAAQALGLVAVAVTDQATSLVGERRLDGGWRERLRVPCPAVCSVEAAGIRLRRASLTATLAVQASAVPEVTIPTGASGLPGLPGLPGRMVVGPLQPFRPRTRVVPPPAGDDPRLRLLALTGALVAHDPPTVIGPVDPPAAADALLDFLHRHGYLADDAPGPETEER
jgi:electron transfer flavoprotein beta subunit